MVPRTVTSIFPLPPQAPAQDRLALAEWTLASQGELSSRRQGKEGARQPQSVRPVLLAANSPKLPLCLLSWTLGSSAQVEPLPI